MIRINHKHNLRDLGGLQVPGNKVVREGFILRSGSLQNLSKGDADKLSRFGLKLVIDLRTPLEIEEKPDPQIPGTVMLQIPLLTDSSMGITHQTGSDPVQIVRRLRKDKDLLQQLIPDMESLYLDMVTKPECQKKLGMAIQTIIEHVLCNETILFHCSEGKDRTGILAAILLNLLGVSRVEVLRDYVRTNHYTYFKALRKGCVVGALTQSFSMGLSTYQLFMAQNRYLIKTMSSLRKHYGSIENYAIQILGLDPVQLEAFKHKMLMPGILPDA